MENATYIDFTVRGAHDDHCSNARIYARSRIVSVALLCQWCSGQNDAIICYHIWCFWCVSQYT